MAIRTGEGEIDGRTVRKVERGGDTHRGLDTRSGLKVA